LSFAQETRRLKDHQELQTLGGGTMKRAVIFFGIMIFFVSAGCGGMRVMAADGTGSILAQAAPAKATNEWKIEGKPALVILHMQEQVMGSFAPPDRAAIIKESDHIPHGQALLKAFRAKNLPVIFITLNMPKNPPGSVPAYGTIFTRVLKSQSDDLKRLQVIPELAPLPGEPVLSNWFMGPFSHSGLQEALKERGVSTVVFFGAALQIAVYNATVQAVDLQYSVIVPQDACFPTEKVSRTPEAAKVRDVFLDLFSNLALVTSADDVIAHLK
jgi:nicotinamidase-related amidase